MDDVDFERADAERRRRRRRALWCLVGGTSALFAAIFAVVVYGDAPEPDVSDLMPRPLVLRDDENLYAQLVAKGAALLANPLIAEDAVDETAPRPAPPAGESGVVAADGTSTAEAGGGGLFGGSADPEEWQAPNLRERLAAGEGWTAGRLALYGSALDAVAADARELLARYPQAQGTIVKDHNSRVPAAEVRAWGEYLRWGAWQKYRGGEQIEAVEPAVLGLRLGRKVRDSGGPLIDYLMGMAIMGLCREPLDAWVNLTETEPSTLRRLAVRLDELGEAGDLTEAYVRSLKLEFLVGHKFLRDYVTAEQSAKEGSGMGKAVDWVAKTRVLFPLIYKRNITMALNAEGWRDQVEWGRMSLAEEERKRRQPSLGLVTCAHCTALSDLTWTRPVNIYGRYLLIASCPMIGRVRLTAANIESRISQLRAAVALRLYSLDHDGALPASLAELVPAYLPAVPRDFADGGEIRYSREARALWSVGVNNLQITAPDQEINDAKREVILWLKFAEPVTAGAGETEAKPAGF